jgi:hypothetical protein
MTEPTDDGLIVDCDTCAVRDVACDDCVISVLLGGPPGSMPVHVPVAIDGVEARALDALADGGLVPPLRLTPRESRAG